MTTSLFTSAAIAFSIQFSNSHVDGAKALNEAVTRIAFKESKNKNIGIHNDGVSYGRLGVTIHPALDQLLAMGWISRLPTEEEICDPGTNAMLGAYYLLACIKMYATNKDGTFDIKKAVGCYHGGKKADRDAYSKSAYELVIQ